MSQTILQPWNFTSQNSDEAHLRNEPKAPVKTEESKFSSQRILNRFLYFTFPFAFKLSGASFMKVPPEWSLAVITKHVFSIKTLLSSQC